MLLISLIVLCSCEKIVHIDLNTTNPKLVVDASYNFASLSRSVNYYENKQINETGAMVIISDNMGQIDTLREFSNGYYSTVTIKKIVDRTYFLNIITKDGSRYSSFSTLPVTVPIDTIFFQYDKPNYYKYGCKFKDPPNKANYYIVETFPHYKDRYVLDDKLTDGKEISITFKKSLFYNSMVTVYLRSIDKATYNFYKSLPVNGEDFDQFLSAPPANPVSNISNGALGCFSVNSQTSRTGIVK